jgi:hypothetical protein
MARKFHTHLDLSRNELQNAVLQVLGADPSTPLQGQMYFSSVSDRPLFRTATAFIDLTARGNHSGTQLANTISNFDAQVRTSRLDQMAAPTAPVAMGSQRITGLADPTGPQDAATRNYVDTAMSAAANVSVLKGTVRAVVSTNVSLASPGTTLDGLTAANGEIFLLTGQTTGSQNGPYVFNGSASAMTRATNWDAAGEAVVGSYWVVQQGTQADRFALMVNDTFTLGTTTATFVYTSAGTSVSAGTGILVAGNTVAIDTAVVVRKFALTLSTSATSLAVTHNLGTLDVQVQVYEVATGDTVECDVTRSTVNQVTLGFTTAPAINSLRVVVQG